MHRLIYTLILLLSLLIGLLQADPGLDFTKILTRLKQDYGNEAQQRGIRWQLLLNDYRKASAEDQLKAVNDFFNQLTFAEDIYVWNQKDYWATPIEFIGRGAGDCEDYSLAKYFSLVEMGFPVENLRLMYVKAINYNQHHMVLTYHPKKGAEPLVLDNLDPEIKPAGLRNDLIPIYSFNADYLWLAKSRSSGQLVGGAERLSLWQDLRARQYEYTLADGEKEPKSQ